MDNKKSYQQINFEEIEKYFSGQMSPEDMHSLEESALNDPFLAEAMEGYHDQKNNWEEVKKQAALLEENLDKKAIEKSAPVFFMNQGWLRIAAVFVVLFLAGGIAWYNWYREEPATTILADKITPPTIQKDTNTQRPDTILLAENKSSKGKAESQKPTAEKPPVTDEKDAATITQAAPVTAMQENKQADSIEGFSRKSALNKADAPVLSAQKEMMAETLPAPFGGLKAFDLYVQERINFYKKMNLKNYLPGKIKIGFKINKNGQPVDYKFIQSLTPIMDSLAAKILHEGPLWTPATPDLNAVVEFHF